MPSPWQACSTVVPGGTSVSWPSMVSLTGSGIALLRRLARRMRAVFGDAALHLGTEMPDQPLHRPHRAVGERADRVAFDLGGHRLMLNEILDRRVALDHPLHDAPDPSQPFAAWGALATALVLVEGRKPGDGADDVGRFVHDDQRRGAEPRFLGDQRVEIHQHVVANRFRQARRRRTAWDHRHQIVPAAAHPAGMPLDELLHRDRHGFFDIARLVYMPGNAKDFRAGVALATDPGDPFRAALQDFGAGRDGLDIVDRRRAAIEPDRGGKWRLQTRLALATLKAFE